MGFELNMSTDEGPELRDLVAQTLENSGVLAKIRAELRASVFLALEEQESFQDKIPFINKSLKEFLKTSQGSLVACLVREFLEFFELDFTLSVFDPETYHGKEYDYCGRNKLISDLQIKNVNERKAPLLSHILQLVSSHFGNDAPVAPTEEDLVLHNRGGKESKQSVLNTVNVKNSTVILNKTFSTNDTLNDSEAAESLEVNTGQVKSVQNSSPLENSSASKSASTLGPSVFDFPLPKKSSSTSDTKEIKKTEVTLRRNEVTKGEDHSSSKQVGSFLSSLGNLPPLSGLNKSTEKLSTSNNVKDTGQGKTVMDLVLEAYDEDFQSSVSGSVREGKNTVASSSDTEIEEDIGSGVDDLLSNASAAEDLTIDVTASNASGIGDYMENV